MCIRDRPESLRGKTVGVEAKTAHEAYLEAYFPDTVRKPYDSQKLLREALVKGEIDTIFGDGISLSLWLDSQEGRICCRYRGGPFTDTKFFGEGVGIAVKKGNSQLRQTLDYALEMCIRDRCHSARINLTTCLPSNPYRSTRREHLHEMFNGFEH